MSKETRVLILDLETSGPDRETCEIYEIGMAIYQIKEGRLEFEKSTSFFVAPHTPADLFNPVVVPSLAANRVEEKEFKSLTKEEAIALVQKSVNMSKFILGHNVKFFDCHILKRHGVTFDNNTLIDTMLHVKYPEFLATRKLLYLCAEHGFLPSKDHRALEDCLSVASLVSFYNLDDIIKRASLKSYVVINSPAYKKEWSDDFRGAGFSWNSESFCYFKKILEDELDEIQKIDPEKILIFTEEEFEARSRSKKVRLVSLKSKESFEKKDSFKQLGFRWDSENKQWFKDIVEFDLPYYEVNLGSSNYQLTQV